MGEPPGGNIDPGSHFGIVLIPPLLSTRFSPAWLRLGVLEQAIQLVRTLGSVVRILGETLQNHVLERLGDR